MRSRAVIGARVAAVLIGVMIPLPAFQTPAVVSVDEKILREFAGAYQWEQDSFLYLQMWSELSGKNQLVAFDESGEVRTLYPTDRDRFFAGPAAATATTVESTIAFTRDPAGRIQSLTWQHNGAAPRVAKRVDIEVREDIQF